MDDDYQKIFHACPAGPEEDDDGDGEKEDYEEIIILEDEKIDYDAE